MSSKTKVKGSSLEKRRKLVESTATFGLLLICVALVSPFMNPEKIDFLKIFKWVFSAGALIYTVARGGECERSLRLFKDEASSPHGILGRGNFL